MEHEIIGLERAALDRWCKGDPSGFLDLSAEDVVYFDPFIPARLDGKAGLIAFYESLRGAISADRFELVNPHVQDLGPAAVLTFNFVSQSGTAAPSRWNCTEVYRRDPQGWRIIATHWSYTEAGMPAG